MTAWKTTDLAEKFSLKHEGTAVEVGTMADFAILGTPFVAPNTPVLTYFSEKGRAADFQEVCKTHPPAAVLCSDALANLVPAHITKLITEKKQIRAAMANLVEVFASPTENKRGIHPKALVEEGATICESVFVGAGAFVSASATLHENVIIHPLAYIGEGVVVGAGSVVFPNATVDGGTQVGKYCTIQSAAVVGGEGFSFAPERGSLARTPHLYPVVLEDFVDVGSGTMIDKGVLHPTKIGMGTKLDNMVHVGHNVTIGRHCYLLPFTSIGGRATFKDKVSVVGHIAVNNGITVGEDTLITPPAFLAKDIPSHSKLGFLFSEVQNFRDALASNRLSPKLVELMQEFAKNALAVESMKDEIAATDDASLMEFSPGELRRDVE